MQLSRCTVQTREIRGPCPATLPPWQERQVRTRARRPVEPAAGADPQYRHKKRG